MIHSEVAENFGTRFNLFEGNQSELPESRVRRFGDLLDLDQVFREWLRLRLFRRSCDLCRSSRIVARRGKER